MDENFPDTEQELGAILNLTERLADAKQITQRKARHITENHVEELCLAYRKARLIKDAMAEAKKQSDAILDALTAAAHEAFGAKQVSSITVDGTRFTLSQRLFASCKKEDQPELHKWLKENGLGSLVIQTVNSSTLSSEMKNRIEKGQALPEVVNTHIKPTISMVKK